MSKENRFNFRAWNGERIINFDYFHIRRGKAWISTEFDGDKETDYILMQSTGLIDKHGVEIYEGDILYHPSGCFGDYEKPSGISVVKHEAYGNDSGFYTSAEVDSGWDEHEVIGNIYEHPEILKGEQE